MTSSDDATNMALAFAPETSRIAEGKTADRADAPARGTIHAVPVGEYVAHSGPLAEALYRAFEIVVASFRTEARAADVVTAITALGEPVQRRFIGGWQQVVAGPYASDDLVRAAQQRLARAGFSGTHIAPTSR